MEAYRMVQQLLGGMSVDGSSLTLLFDRGEVGQVKMELWSISPPSQSPL